MRLNTLISVLCLNTEVMRVRWIGGIVGSAGLGFINTKSLTRFNREIQRGEERKRELQ